MESTPSQPSSGGFAAIATGSSLCLQRRARRPPSGPCSCRLSAARSRGCRSRAQAPDQPETATPPTTPAEHHARPRSAASRLAGVTSNVIWLTRRCTCSVGGWDGPRDLSSSSAVLHGRPLHRQRGDVPLDEGVEAGNVSPVGLGCFQVAASEDLGVQEVDQALAGRAASAEGG